MGGTGFGVAVGLSPRENQECYVISISNLCIAISIFVSLGGVRLIGVLLIGVRYAKKNESVSDFYLGGRKLGPIVTAMSAAASDMWNDLLLGLPGLAYLSGLDDHRACAGYIFQLAFGSALSAQIHPHDRLLRVAAILFAPLSGGGMVSFGTISSNRWAACLGSMNCCRRF